MKIEISNLTIAYDQRQIAYVDKIELRSGDLCLFTGHSGTGKSSLLKLLSLSDKVDFDCTYFINGSDVSLLSEEERSKLKLNHIAYVSQDNLIFGEFSVLDNLETFCEIGYGKVDKEKIDELIQKLSIEKIIDKKAKKLSGGEKQRVAIGCAILKNADLYLFDEPTSMIDIDNKKAVIEVISDLVKQGKIVVVVSHEEELFYPNKEYFFEKGTVQLVKDLPAYINDGVSKKENLNKLLHKITTKIFFSTPIINATFVTLISICISIIITIFAFSLANVEGQKETASIVNNPEVFVINTQEHARWFYDTDRYMAISDEIVESIRSLENVISVNRFTYFPLERYSLKEGEKELTHTSYKDSSWIRLYREGKEISSFNYFDEFLESYYDKAYAIFPTFSHQNIETQCSSVYETDERGIYVSKKIAEKLGISKANGETINLTFTVPIASDPSYTFSDEYPDIIKIARAIFGAEANGTFVIKGILETDIEYYKYEGYYDAVFFMDPEVIEEIQLEYFKKYESVILELNEIPMPNDELRKYYKTRLVDKNMWQSSALVIHVDKSESVDSVAKEIGLLDPGLTVHVTDYGMTIIDTELVRNVWMNAITYIGVILVILLVALAIIKGYRRRQRVRDFELLTINGYNARDIQTIEYNEIIIETSIISFVSTIITLIFIHFVNTIMFYKARFSVNYIIIIVVLTFIMLAIGDFVSKRFRQLR